MSAGGRETFEAKDVTYSVERVNLYISAEDSATGFEIPITGVLKIVKVKDVAYINWTPSELTIDDVASFYAVDDSDHWTIIEDVPDNVGIDVSDVTLPEPLLEVQSPEGSGPDLKSPQIRETKESKVPPPRPPPPKGRDEMSQSLEKKKKEGKGEDKDGGVESVPSKKQSLSLSAPKCRLPIHFPIFQIQAVRETSHHGKGTASLTFYFTSGDQLSPLHFHDGGTSGFLKAMGRFTYLVRSGQDLDLLVVEEMSRFDPPRLRTISLNARSKRDRQASSSPKLPTRDDVSGLISDAGGALFTGFSRVTKLVKSNILPAKGMPERRPGCESSDEEEKEVAAASVVCQDMPSTRGGATPETSTDVEVSLVSDFQLIDDVRAIMPPLPGRRNRSAPVSRVEWESYRDFDGRISEENERKFRVRVFCGGIDPKLRRELWKYLLGYHKFGDTDLDRMEERMAREEEYFRMKQQWQSLSETQIKHFTSYRECSSLVHKDVVRTDRDNEMFKDTEGPKLKQLEDILRTYLMYNVDLGYVQGMSDLLAPLLVVMDNEVDAFWCFVGYMNMVHKYFEKSQERTKDRLKVLRLMLSVQEQDLYDHFKKVGANNMFFAFRWILINFKREFTYSSVMKIWEVIWCGILSTDHALCVAIAILGQQREALLQAEDQSAILKLVNELAYHLDADEILALAEAYALQLHHSQSLPDELKALLVRGGKEELFTGYQVTGSSGANGDSPPILVV